MDNAIQSVLEMRCSLATANNRIRGDLISKKSALDVSVGTSSHAFYRIAGV